MTLEANGDAGDTVMLARAECVLRQATYFPVVTVTRFRPPFFASYRARSADLIKSAGPSLHMSRS